MRALHFSSKMKPLNCRIQSKQFYVLAGNEKEAFKTGKRKLQRG
jgi:hypothetical protein